MAFGNGFTGILVATIVTLSSGAAFIICFREFFREILDWGEAEFGGAAGEAACLDFARGETATKLTETAESDNQTEPRVWERRSTYLLMVGFLGLVGVAGFVAGLTHFASKSLV